MPPPLSFVTLDVFTTTPFAGNPLAVVKVPAGRAVSTEQMQTIAREFNLSETVFLHESGSESESDKDGDREGGGEGGGGREWAIRIFLTKAEIPFAGHPTIGAACHALGSLANGAKTGRLLCAAGPIEVEFAAGVARADIPHDVHVHAPGSFGERDALLLQPGLDGVEEGGGADVVVAVDVVSPVKGMNFVCVELARPELLMGRVGTTGVRPAPRLDHGWDTGFAGSYWYVVTDRRSVGGEGMAKVRTRMIEGVLEDPATGSAACALAALLAMKWKLARVTRFEITQGVEMGRKSDIGVVLTLNDDMSAVGKMELSGSAVEIMEGVVRCD